MGVEISDEVIDPTKARSLDIRHNMVENSSQSKCYCQFCYAQDILRIKISIPLKTILNRTI